MPKQALHRQVHVWLGEELTVHMSKKSVSLLGNAETKTTMQQIHTCCSLYFSTGLCYYVG